MSIEFVPQTDSDVREGAAPSLDEIFQWDVLNWSKALAYWEAYLAGCQCMETVLLLGERDGGLALWFAGKGFQVVCSDIDGPTENARQLHRKHRVSNRISYEAIDIFDIPYADKSFDVVACKSVIGGLKQDRKKPETRNLANQKAAITEAWRVLRPGGVFLGAENMCGTPLHQALRRMIKGRALGWRYLALAEIDYLFDQFSTIHKHAYGILGTRSSLSWVNLLSDRLNQVLCPMTPPTWQYICFVMARK
jgi:SAM-dependent methyltransferase